MFLVAAIAIVVIIWLLWLPILTYKFGYVHGIQDTTGRIRGEPWPKRWFIPTTRGS